jgi:hypothetical protein
VVAQLLKWTDIAKQRLTFFANFPQNTPKIEFMPLFRGVFPETKVAHDAMFQGKQRDFLLESFCLFEKTIKGN